MLTWSGVKSVCLKLKKNITIEPFLLIYYFSLTLASTTSAILYPVKVCMKDFKNYNTYYPYNMSGEYDKSLHQAICLDLEDNVFLQGLSDNNITVSFNPLVDEVQGRASLISATALGIQIVPAILSTLIIVNGADKIGRKMLFIIPVFGYFLYNLSFTLNWYYKEVSSWLLTAEAVHECLGGRHVITVAAILYISDISTPEHRTLRMNIVGLIELVASAIGTGVAGTLLTAENILGSPGHDDIYNGFYSVYGISTCLYIIGILYIIFIVKETRTKDKITEKLAISNIFSPTKIVGTLKSVFRKREHGIRKYIVLLILTYILIAINYGGVYLSGSLWLYYQKLGWTIDEFTTFISIHGIMVLFGCLTVVMFLIKKQVHDMTLGFVGEVCAICSMLVYVFTPYGNHWVPYLSIIFSLVTGVVGTVCKSQLSKIVPSDEISNVMAIFGMLIPVTTIGPPIFNLVYKWSLDLAACNSVERGEKDWCSAVFIGFGSSLLFINAAIFGYLRVSIGRNK